MMMVVETVVFMHARFINGSAGVGKQYIPTWECRRIWASRLAGGLSVLDAIIRIDVAARLGLESG